MTTTSFKPAVFTAAAAVADVKTHGTGGSPNTSYTPRHFSAVTRQHDRNKGRGKKSGAGEREHVWVEGGRGGGKEGGGGGGKTREKDGEGTPRGRVPRLRSCGSPAPEAAIPHPAAVAARRRCAGRCGPLNRKQTDLRRHGGWNM